jgi:MinD-like ATPase involved in chromosome partitioning or flagellar assembly
MEHEQDLVNLIRSRQRGARVVAFVGSKGGVGTTTTAIGVMLTLASSRSEAVVLLDGKHGSSSLARRVAGRPAPTIIDLLHDPQRRAPLQVDGSRLHLVDGAAWNAPVPSGELLQLLEGLREHHQFIGVDAGPSGAPAAYEAHRADQVVIVTAASKDALDDTYTTLQRIGYFMPDLATNAIVAIVFLSTRTQRMVTRSLRNDLGLTASRIVPVPFDAGLCAGGRFEPDRLRAVTREAYLRLAALTTDPYPRTSGTYPPPGAAIAHGPVGRS